MHTYLHNGKFIISLEFSEALAFENVLSFFSVEQLTNPERETIQKLKSLVPNTTKRMRTIFDPPKGYKHDA